MGGVSAEIKRHWDRCRDVGCIVAGGDAEIAHCHGGSVIGELGYHWQPGMAQRQNHWLVLPLSPALHRGRFGLDTHPGGVTGWERMYWSQMVLLRELSDELGYDVIERAAYGREQ